MSNDTLPANTLQPLDTPDGVGFWAWKEGEQRGVSEVYAGFRNELIVDEEPGGLTPDYYSGRKWWRLTMPWEPQSAPHMDALREQLDTVAHNNSVLNAEIVALQAQLAEQAGLCL